MRRSANRGRSSENWQDIPSPFRGCCCRSCDSSVTTSCFGDPKSKEFGEYCATKFRLSAKSWNSERIEMKWTNKNTFITNDVGHISSLRNGIFHPERGFQLHNSIGTTNVLVLMLVGVKHHFMETWLYAAKFLMKFNVMSDILLKRLANNFFMVGKTNSTIWSCCA